MQLRSLDARGAPEALGGYAQACEVAGASRLLFVSGQVPVTRDGTVPASFADQCRTAWANLEAQLEAAGMSVPNLVKVTTFLASRDHAVENRAIRTEILRGHRPALTVIVPGIFDESWLLEIEAVAAA